jgi:hypothetical protein
MWKMDIGSSYNILKVAEQKLRFSDIFNSMNFAGDRPYKSNGQFNWKVNLFI